jgi:phage-related protein (TIGR01555 family)
MRKKKLVSRTAQTAQSTKAISPALLSMAKSKPPVVEISAYSPPAGVVPNDAALAMDSSNDYVNQYANNFTYGNHYFIGYPTLSAFAQSPEYRKISETIAEEMTRKWIKITSKGDEDKTEVIAKINEAIERYKLQAKFQRVAELDGFFGRGQLFIDLGSDRDDEVATPLTLSPTKIKKGSLKGFNLVEPVWTYPADYNSTNPLRDDFYKPKKWYVMGKTVDGSRMLTFISREVPDLFKPAYNFSGISLSQLAKSYVDNFIRTRDSVSDMVHSFSINGVKTDMASVLVGKDSQSFFDRVDLFNSMRDNFNTMLLDKDSEEFFQFNIPLNGLDSLQAQSQEQLASVSSIPLVKLLGITPSGLNASSEGEIKVFYDHIHAMQEKIFLDNLRKALDVIMLSELGEIDKDITFRFESLHALSEVEQAQVRKTNADTDAVYVGMGSLAREEVRQKLASDENSGYDNLTDDLPEVDDPELDDEDQNDL